MVVRMTWTDCGEAGDYVVLNAFSPRVLVSRPDNMDETVQHTKFCDFTFCKVARAFPIEHRNPHFQKMQKLAD